jgi:hypothetical protein
MECDISFRFVLYSKLEPNLSYLDMSVARPGWQLHPYDLCECLFLPLNRSRCKMAAQKVVGKRRRNQGFRKQPASVNLRSLNLPVINRKLSRQPRSGLRETGAFHCKKNKKSLALRHFEGRRGGGGGAGQAQAQARSQARGSQQHSQRQRSSAERQSNQRPPLPFTYHRPLPTSKSTAAPRWTAVRRER